MLFFVIAKNSFRHFFLFTFVNFIRIFFGGVWGVADCLILTKPSWSSPPSPSSPSSAGEQTTMGSPLWSRLSKTRKCNIAPLALALAFSKHFLYPDSWSSSLLWYSLLPGVTQTSAYLRTLSAMVKSIFIFSCPSLPGWFGPGHSFREENCPRLMVLGTLCHLKTQNR